MPKFRDKEFFKKSFIVDFGYRWLCKACDEPIGYEGSVCVHCGYHDAIVDGIETDQDHPNVKRVNELLRQISEEGGEHDQRD